MPISQTEKIWLALQIPSIMCFDFIQVPSIARSLVGVARSQQMEREMKTILNFRREENLNEANFLKSNIKKLSW